MKTYTLHQAAKESGLTITTLIQGIRKNLLQTEQRPTVSGTRLQHYCTQAQLDEFLAIYEDRMKAPVTKVLSARKSQHTIPEDQIALGKTKRRLEIHREAREMGVSIGEYMSWIEHEVGYD